MAEAEDFLTGLRASYGEMQVSIQPLVFSLPNGSVVVYDSNRFAVESLVKAVDLCFKLTHVWNLFLKLYHFLCL